VRERRGEKEKRRKSVWQFNYIFLPFSSSRSSLFKRPMRFHSMKPHWAIACRGIMPGVNSVSPSNLCGFKHTEVGTQQQYLVLQPPKKLFTLQKVVIRYLSAEVFVHGNHGS
jgi:hypothetical protein